MKHVAIVMSAGKGLRVGGDIPKQYMDLLGKPVLYYSLKTFEESFIDEVVIVCGSGHEAYVKKEIVDRFSFNKVKKIVSGGKERSDSVYNGLMAVENPDKSYVYIHDGARPMLTVAMLESLKEDAECFGTAVLGVKCKDTVKIVNEDGFVSTTPKREFLWNVQTPQVFKGDDLIEAYDSFHGTKNATATDDASVMESFGALPVHITEGNYSNIKITTPEDFKIAEILMDLGGNLN